VKTNSLKLVSTHEVNLDLGPELSFPLRIERFKDTERRGWFRAHAWGLEHFNPEPTFPVRSKSGKAWRHRATALLMLERITQLTCNHGGFGAKSAADALGQVVADLKERLAHWTKEKAA
jgi:hypothetical protein